MKPPEEAELLRIFIGEGDKHKGSPLYEVIVQEARRRGMAGATVLRGIQGFGANSLVHTSKILRISEGMPIVVEIVDSTPNIEAFLPYLDLIISEGLVTRERANVIFYRQNAK